MLLHVDKYDNLGTEVMEREVGVYKVGDATIGLYVGKVGIDHVALSVALWDDENLRLKFLRQFITNELADTDMDISKLSTETLEEMGKCFGKLTNLNSLLYNIDVDINSTLAQDIREVVTLFKSNISNRNRFWSANFDKAEPTYVGLRLKE